MVPNAPIFLHDGVQFYDVWTTLLSAAVVVLFAHFVIRGFPSFWLLSSPPPYTRRGPQHATVEVPTYGPFHPQLPPVEDEPVQSAVVHVVLQVIDDVIRPAMDLVWAGMSVAFLLAGKINRTFSRPYLVETFVLPIKIRVRQAIAQMPVPAIPASGVSYRYMCPTLFLLVLFNGLVSMFGVPILLAGLVCFVGGMTLYAADRMGVGEDEENVVLEAGSTPEMTGVGQAAVLNGQPNRLP